MWVKCVQEEKKSGKGRPQLTGCASVHLISLCIFTVLFLVNIKMWLDVMKRESNWSGTKATITNTAER